MDEEIIEVEINGEKIICSKSPSKGVLKFSDDKIVTQM